MQRTKGYQAAVRVHNSPAVLHFACRSAAGRLRQVARKGQCADAVFLAHADAGDDVDDRGGELGLEGDLGPAALIPGVGGKGGAEALEELAEGLQLVLSSALGQGNIVPHPLGCEQAKAVAGDELEFAGQAETFHQRVGILDP